MRGAFVPRSYVRPVRLSICISRFLVSSQIMMMTCGSSIVKEVPVIVFSKLIVSPWNIISRDVTLSIISPAFGFDVVPGHVASDQLLPLRFKVRITQEPNISSASLARFTLVVYCSESHTVVINIFLFRTISQFAVLPRRASVFTSSILFNTLTEMPSSSPLS